MVSLLLPRLFFFGGEAAGAGTAFVFIPGLFALASFFAAASDLVVAS
jgi:hypothetical protein